jgi:hypothetical protein
MLSFRPQRQTSMNKNIALLMRSCWRGMLGFETKRLFWLQKRTSDLTGTSSQQGLLIGEGKCKHRNNLRHRKLPCPVEFMKTWHVSLDFALHPRGPNPKSWLTGYSRLYLCLTFGCRRLRNAGTANIANMPLATHVENFFKSQWASHALDEAGGMEKRGRMHDNFESSSSSGRLKHAVLPCLTEDWLQERKWTIPD